VIRAFLSAIASVCFAFAAHAADIEGARHKPRLRSTAPVCCGEVYRYVFAEAWYGNQRLIAPVRRVGCCDQVQVPGGAWVECAFTCETTLRKLRLEYWQWQGAGYNKELSPGYPREDFFIDPFGNRIGYLF
jgi:hypothetical protein